MPAPGLISRSNDIDSPFEKFRARRSNDASAVLSSRKGQRIFRYLVLLLVMVGLLGYLYSPKEGRPVSNGGPIRHQSRTGKHPQKGIEKATFIMLVRNRELKDALLTMKQIEDHFNKNYHYPWTFLNDEPFEDEFINLTSAQASGRTEYGLIPPEQWTMPAHIDEEKYQEAVTILRNEDVMYADSKAYRHMCRFNTGFFYNHELIRKYDWYWRVEPGTGFYCDQTYDPFTFMRENKKRYSFVITMPEFPATIRSLWNVTRGFIASHPQHLAPNNSVNFIVDDFDEGINGAFNFCHFWSNFEIADLTFFRSPTYTAYFSHLDSTTGFYYERWGDAPIHSLAASLFLNKDEIHFWSDIGYSHDPYGRCPQDKESYSKGRCTACRFTKWKSFDVHNSSCLGRWYRMFGRDEWGGVLPAGNGAVRPTARVNLAGKEYYGQR